MTPSWEKNTSLSRILKKCAKNGLLARFLQVDAFLERSFLALHFLNLARNLIFRRILPRIYCLQESYKILQDSARTMHYVAKFCKDLVRLARILQEMYFSSTRERMVFKTTHKLGNLVVGTLWGCDCHSHAERYQGFRAQNDNFDFSR